MGKVYVVTEGIRSDYKIAGIFSDRKLAEKMRSILEYANEIEEYPINELNPKIAQGYKLYCVEDIDRYGN